MSTLVLDLEEVAEMLGVKKKTISQYRWFSTPGHRYAERPFPEPDRMVGRSPFWAGGRREEIQAWFDNRPGRGAGGGRPS